VRKYRIGQTVLQGRSRELGLPLERIFACYVKEQLALRLSAASGGKRFLLKNPRSLSLHEPYDSRRLSYGYVMQEGEQFTRAAISQSFRQVLKCEQETSITWNWQSRMAGDHMCVELVAELDGMELPLELLVYPMSLEDAGLAATQEIRLLMENNGRTQIAVYPQEALFFEDMGELLTKLELMGDMAVYERIYEGLGILSFEGRQFWQKLEASCTQWNIKLDEMRYQQLERYRTYPYLIKKWKAYLRKNGRQLPTWDDVYGRIWEFLSPPWEAAKKDLIYLGTWIPDIGRYLD
jgi:hypothetical protein